MIEKVTEGLQYTNRYRNSSKFKKANTTINAVGRLEKARKERAKRGPIPPRNEDHLKILPLTYHHLHHHHRWQCNMLQNMLERKNRNSWSIKEIPTNTKEEATDQIQHTDAMYALPDNTVQNTKLPENKLSETKLSEKN